MTVFANGMTRGFERLMAGLEREGKRRSARYRKWPGAGTRFSLDYVNEIGKLVSLNTSSVNQTNSVKSLSFSY
jgi:hypothetical protein